MVCDPYKQLDIDFLKNAKKNSTKKVSIPEKNPKKSNSKYQEIIKDFNKIDGLWNFYYSKDKNKM